MTSLGSPGFDQMKRTADGQGGEPDFLEQLRERLEALSPSERRVAEFVLENPGDVIHMSIAHLADTVGVSQPTVLRLVRTLGLKRFPELKLLTGQAIVSGTPYVHRDVSPSDPIETIAKKVLGSSVLALQTLERGLDYEALEQVVDILAHAPRIDCYGTGAASILAIEAQHKLMRLGLPVICYNDTHLQRLAAASLRRRDVALCFSHTGMIRDAVKMAEAARQRGATTIAFSRADTALSKACDLVLAIDSSENTEIYAPMTSRVAHAVMIDIVATSLTLRLGPDIFRQLQEAKDSLADLRLPCAENGRNSQRKSSR